MQSNFPGSIDLNRRKPRDPGRIDSVRMGECLGDHTLTGSRRFQMAEKPPSTFNSTPFTKLESSEARNNATDAISSG